MPLGLGLGIGPLLFFGLIGGFFVAQFTWIFFGQLQIALDIGYPGALLFTAPLIYQIGWMLAGVLGVPLHYSSKGKII